MSDGAKLYGQRIMRDLENAVEVYYRQKLDYASPTGDNATRKTGTEGTANLEVTPVDREAAEAEYVDLTATQAALDAVTRQSRGKVNLNSQDIPDTLTGITVVYAKSFGNGLDELPADQQIAYNIFNDVLPNQQFSPTASAQSTGTVVVELIPLITPNSKANVDTDIATFWIAENSTLAQVLAKAKTVLTGNPDVLAWPKWGERYHRLIVRSEKYAVRASAQTKAAIVALNNIEKSWGSGYSYDMDVTLKPITIGPVINAAIASFTNGASDTQDVSASADASTPDINPDFPLRTVDAIANVSTQTGTATGSVTPTSLPASTVTAVPSFGVYAYRIESGQTLYGRTLYRVETINFAQF